MGEIADAMIYGACCSQCGTYFEREHGYAVLCPGCYCDLQEEDKEDFQEATESEL